MTPQDLERPEVRSWVESRCRRWGGAEDLSQDVYVKLLARGARALRACLATEDAQQRAYLLTVCDSVARDAARRVLTIKRGRHYVAVDCGVLEHMASPEPDPEEALRARESVHERIRELCHASPHPERLHAMLAGLVVF